MPKHLNASAAVSREVSQENEGTRGCVFTNGRRQCPLVATHRAPGTHPGGCRRRSRSCWLTCGEQRRRGRRGLWWPSRSTGAVDRHRRRKSGGARRERTGTDSVIWSFFDPGSRETIFKSLSCVISPTSQYLGQIPSHAGSEPVRSSWTRYAINNCMISLVHSR